MTADTLLIAMVVTGSAAAVVWQMNKQKPKTVHHHHRHPSPLPPPKPQPKPRPPKSSNRPRWDTIKRWLREARQRGRKEGRRGQ